ncbi:MAG: NAD(P)H-dependent oxidoreductase [Kaistella sp.]|jgi:chromate reductase|nr:NAD(P)H-dependent oxidoreductase [Kaistella sp.]
MKILAFAGSNSTVSINKKLVTFASTFFSDDEVEILDLNDFEMPIYKREIELASGTPQKALDFAAKIDECDLILLSTPENNGNFPAVFKNLMDWISRIKGRKIFGGKPMFLMATSDGGRGGASVLEIAEKRFPFDGAEVIEIFSLPKFSEYFDAEKGIVNEEKLEEFKEKVQKVKLKFS